MAGDVFLLAASFAVILTGAIVFTNAVEWLGNRLGLGEGAVGSLLAAVGTAMPESLIPIVAVIEGGEGSEEVAIGAIVGAPFLLATIAMLLVGLSALAYLNRRPQGRHLDVHAPTLDRDLLVFLAFFAAALVLGVIGLPVGIRAALAAGFVLGYVLYVRATLSGGGSVQDQETIGPLLLDRTREGDPSLRLILLQFAVGLGAIVGGAHLFVGELITVAEEIGVEVLILSLVLAPLATELPEKANSFFWVRDGKDALALGNITGAMVFQSMLPVALGLVLTEWDLDRFAVLSMVLGLAGGVVAYWALRRRNQFNAPAIVAWGGLYAIFLGFVLTEA